MKKWDEILTRVIIPAILAWATWVTSTLYNISSDLKLLKLKAGLSIADVTLGHKKDRSINADSGHSLYRLIERGIISESKEEK